MGIVYRLFIFFGLPFLCLGLVTPRILNRCGHPELPYRAITRLSQDFFNEDESLPVRCREGVIIHNGSHNETASIDCREGTWQPKDLKCSVLLPMNRSRMEESNIVAEIFDIDDVLREEHLHILSDRNPETCIQIQKMKTMRLPLNESAYVTHIMLVVTHMEDDILHNRNSTQISITTSDDMIASACTLDDHSHSDALPVIFAVYRCDSHNLTDHIRVHVNPPWNGTVRVCDVDVFAIRESQCGPPEKPLYSILHDSRLQPNGSMTVEYSCMNGYDLVGVSQRVCGRDSLWYPMNVPRCVPKVTCPFLTQSDSVNGTFMFAYMRRDLNGNIIGGRTEVEYLCSKLSHEPSMDARRVCLESGVWSPIREDIRCEKKDALVIGKFRLKKDQVMLMYVCSAAFLMVAAFGGLVLHSRRMARRMKRRWREDQYRQSETRSIPGFGVDNYYTKGFTDWSDGELIANQEEDSAKNRF